jgi:hypothetical protein
LIIVRKKNKYSKDLIDKRNKDGPIPNSLASGVTGIYIQSAIGCAPISSKILNYSPF